MKLRLIFVQAQPWVAIGVGLAMLAFGSLKIQDPASFLKAIHEYDFLPTEPPILLNLLAIWIPVLEILGGFGLIFNRGRKGAALTLGLFLLCFTVGVAIRGHGLAEAQGSGWCAVAFDCGCGTGIVNLCNKLLENSLLILGCLWICLCPTRDS